MRKSRLRPVGALSGVAIGSLVFIGILIVFFFTLAATTGEQGLPRVRFLVFLASAVVLVSMFATAQMTKLAVMGRVQQVLAKTFTTGEVHTVLRRLAKEYGDVCSGEINLQGWSSRDGDEAVESLKTNKPDLILLDIVLPKMSGFEIMEKIKNDPGLNKAPIIIISNLGQETDVSKGEELGAVGYFVKANVSIGELVDQVKKFFSTPPAIPR